MTTLHFKNDLETVTVQIFYKKDEILPFRYRLFMDDTSSTISSCSRAAQWVSSYLGTKDCAEVEHQIRQAATSLMEIG